MNSSVDYLTSRIGFYDNDSSGRAGKANRKFSFLAFANASDSDEGAAARRWFWVGGLNFN